MISRIAAQLFALAFTFIAGYVWAQRARYVDSSVESGSSLALVVLAFFFLALSDFWRVL